MRTNLINRLKEEWSNLDPVDPLRGLIADAIDALAEAQQQKPVARVLSQQEMAEAAKRYTSPPQRKPLTDEQISNLWDGHTVPVFGKTGINPIVFARAIEAAHGIKGEA